METIAKDAEIKGETVIPNQDGSENLSKEITVIYVLGGPGSGKSTQCSMIAKHFGFCHISVGDLLQAEIDSRSEIGTMIEDFKKEGKLVPSEIVVKLLQQAMQGSKIKKFLIDGFPRNEENRIVAENILKIEPEFVLFFDCSEEELMRRLLSRNQGRVDDNRETIRKRIKVFLESTVPVINYYSLKGKLQKIDAQRPIDEVFEEVKSVFSKFKLGSEESKLSPSFSQ